MNFVLMGIFSSFATLPMAAAVTRNMKANSIVISVVPMLLKAGAMWFTEFQD